MLNKNMKKNIIILSVVLPKSLFWNLEGIYAKSDLNLIMKEKMLAQNQENILSRQVPEKNFNLKLQFESCLPYSYKIIGLSYCVL